MTGHTDLLGPIDRRTFLRGTAKGAALLTGAALLPVGCGGYTPVQGLHVLTAKEFAVLQALANVFTAGADGAPTAADLDLARYLDAFFEGETPENQTQLKRALLLIEYGGLIWGKPHRRFTRMHAPAQADYVDDWLRADSSFRRQAVEVFRRACLNAYYSDERTWTYVGYDGPFV